MKLTTNHPASSYGFPVLLDENTGDAYGPADIIPDLRITAAELVSIGAYQFGLEQALKFCGQWSDGPQPGRSIEQIYSDALNRRIESTGNSAGHILQ